MAAGGRAPERPVLADEVLLADELREVARPHPRRQRLLLGRRSEDRGLAVRTAGRSARGHRDQSTGAMPVEVRAG